MRQTVAKLHIFKTLIDENDAKGFSKSIRTLANRKFSTAAGTIVVFGIQLSLQLLILK